MRCCVCTSLEAAQEPRAPRHARWLASLHPGCEVIFVDAAPFGAERRPLKALEGLPNLEWRTHHFPTRASQPFRLAWRRLCQRAARQRFRVQGTITAGALSIRAMGLEQLLVDLGADLYLAHNSETLWPAWNAARRRGALVLFDSMEFHSDMGDSQTPVERDLVRAVERRCLPECALVYTASEPIAVALRQEYGLGRLEALYNVPDVEPELPAKPTGGLQLYWRNAVVGLGQRGLEDGLAALANLPAEVTLHLQGRLPADGGAGLRSKIQAMGLTNRVRFLAPYAPEDAVKEAARHHVGLCLERKGCRNHDLTVSNKIFDYHMAGLAVVASDLPGLRGVLERSRGGLQFAPGDVGALTAQIRQLLEEPQLVKRLGAQAREFALREGNRDRERQKFVAALESVCPLWKLGMQTHVSNRP